MMRGAPELPETPNDESYKAGVKQMEAAFNDGAQKLRDCFQKCMDSLDFAFNDMLQRQSTEFSRHKKNASFLHNYYSEVHSKLLAMKLQIQKDKEALAEGAPAWVPAPARPPRQFVWFDVSGAKIRTTMETLTAVKGSLLEKMFSERAHLTQEGPVYLERDGIGVKEVLNFLHRGRQHLPIFPPTQELELFRKELEFWELFEDLERLNIEHPKQNPQSANKQLIPGPFPEPLVTMLQSEPDSQSPEVRT